MSTDNVPAIGDALVDAAAEAYADEARRWIRLPHHGGGRPVRAERRGDEPQSFVNGATPQERPAPLGFDSVQDRDRHIQRACMRAAIEAYQRAGGQRPRQLGAE